MSPYKIRAIIITTIFFLLPFVLFYLMGRSGIEFSSSCHVFSIFFCDVPHGTIGFCVGWLEACARNSRSNAARWLCAVCHRHGAV